MRSRILLLLLLAAAAVSVPASVAGATEPPRYDPPIEDTDAVFAFESNYQGGPTGVYAAEAARTLQIVIGDNQTCDDEGNCIPYPSPTPPPPPPPSPPPPPPPSSCSGPVVIYDGLNRTGACKAVGVGTYGWIGNDWNDRVSSIYVAPGYVAVLFQHSNYGGSSYQSGTSNTIYAPVGDNAISSLGVLDLATEQAITSRQLLYNEYSSGVVASPSGSLSIPCWWSRWHDEDGEWIMKRHLWMQVDWCGTGGKITSYKVQTWATFGLYCPLVVGPTWVRLAGGVGSSYVDIEARASFKCNMYLAPDPTLTEDIDVRFHSDGRRTNI